MISIAAVTLSIVLIAALLIWTLSRAAGPQGEHNSLLPAAHTSPPSGCHESNGLPDAICTPGAASVDVTEGSIRITICSSGYTVRGIRSDGRPVRPPSSYTEPLKVSGIVGYGYADTNLGDYEEDHLVPLELGGDGWNRANLWPEPRYGAHPSTEKDRVENELHRLVCAGQVGVRAAQQAIAADWETALMAVT
jgi:hypothetical protein